MTEFNMVPGAMQTGVSSFLDVPCSEHAGEWAVDCVFTDTCAFPHSLWTKLKKARVGVSGGPAASHSLAQGLCYGSPLMLPCDNYRCR